MPNTICYDSKETKNLFLDLETSNGIICYWWATLINVRTDINKSGNVIELKDDSIHKLYLMHVSAAESCGEETDRLFQCFPPHPSATGTNASNAGGVN